MINVNVGLALLVTMLTGLLIFAAPRQLTYIGTVYLILIGLLGLFGAGDVRPS